MRGDRVSVPASLQFSELQRDLARLSVRQQRALKSEITRAGQGALSDARSRAGAWSSRIPNAISGAPRVNAARGKVGYTLYVNVRRGAPHGRVFEGITQDGPADFDHPVFGSYKTWAEQRTRPFLWPAVRGRAVGMNRNIDRALDQAIRDAGFR